MPIPGLFAVPVIGAAADLIPRGIATVIERGGDVNNSEVIRNRGIRAQDKGEQLIRDMKENAKAIQLMKKGL